MSDPVNRCIVHPIQNIRQHPTLASLRVAEVGGHQVVVGDHYEEGALGIFIPDGAIVPDKLAGEMWVLGKLAGSKRNKVRARERGGVRSDGLFYGSRFFSINDGQVKEISSASWNPAWKEGRDVTDEIGVTF